MTRIFYDEDVPPHALEGETVAVLGYGIQGRAQALTLRDSGVNVIVGNRVDKYSHLAKDDGFTVHDLGEAAERGSVLLVLIPDELQAQVYEAVIKPRLRRGKALVFAHGFAVHYKLIEPPRDVDVLLLAPRLPGQYLRGRYLDGWGVPAFVGIHRDATGRAWMRLLGLARALGVTRCAAIETTFAAETELDHFSEHVTYPLIFHALEIAFETLVQEGYPPEIALMELHGSGEMGQILAAAADEGLFEMIETHASPACKAGIAHHWDRAVGSSQDLRTRMLEAIEAIRSGEFARHLVDQQAKGYPELREWKANRSERLSDAEESLREWLRGPSASRYA